MAMSDDHLDVLIQSALRVSISQQRKQASWLRVRGAALQPARRDGQLRFDVGALWRCLKTLLLEESPYEFARRGQPFIGVCDRRGRPIPLGMDLVQAMRLTVYMMG